MPTTYTLLAQAADPPAEKAQPVGPPKIFGMDPLTVMMVMGVLFMLVVWMPATRRQKREQQTMMAALKRGSKVETSSGIIGTVVSLKDTEDELVLRSEDAKLKVRKTTVVRVLGHEDDAK